MKGGGYLACSSCRVSDRCLPGPQSGMYWQQIDGLVANRRVVRRKEALFRRGEPFTALYAICAGVFKLGLTAEDGREQVSAFQRTGDMLGLDGIAGGEHACDAVALQDAVVCVLPLARLEQLGREMPAVQRRLHQIMSREILREQRMRVLLGKPRAAERVAGFLLDLAEVDQGAGPGAAECVLPMTRQEIAAYLALTIETVSRTFSRLVAHGVIEISRRDVRIVDPDALRRLADSQAPSGMG